MNREDLINLNCEIVKEVAKDMNVIAAKMTKKPDAMIKKSDAKYYQSKMEQVAAILDTLQSKDLVYFSRGELVNGVNLDGMLPAKKMYGVIHSVIVDVYNKIVDLLPKFKFSIPNQYSSFHNTHRHTMLLYGIADTREFFHDNEEELNKTVENIKQIIGNLPIIVVITPSSIVIKYSTKGIKVKVVGWDKIK